MNHPRRPCYPMRAACLTAVVLLASCKTVQCFGMVPSVVSVSCHSSKMCTSARPPTKSAHSRQPKRHPGSVLCYYQTHDDENHHQNHNSYNNDDYNYNNFFHDIYTDDMDVDDDLEQLSTHLQALHDEMARLHTDEAFAAHWTTALALNVETMRVKLELMAEQSQLHEGQLQRAFAQREELEEQLDLERDWHNAAMEAQMQEAQSQLTATLATLQTKNRQIRALKEELASQSELLRWTESAQHNYCDPRKAATASDTIYDAEFVTVDNHCPMDDTSVNGSVPQETQLEWLTTENAELRAHLQDLKQMHTQVLETLQKKTDRIHELEHEVLSSNSNNNNGHSRYNGKGVYNYNGYDTYSSGSTGSSGGAGADYYNGHDSGYDDIYSSSSSNRNGYHSYSTDSNEDAAETGEAASYIPPEPRRPVENFHRVEYEPRHNGNSRDFHGAATEKVNPRVEFEPHPHHSSSSSKDKRRRPVETFHRVEYEPRQPQDRSSKDNAKTVNRVKYEPPRSGSKQGDAEDFASSFSPPPGSKRQRPVETFHRVEFEKPRTHDKTNNPEPAPYTYSSIKDFYDRTQSQSNNEDVVYNSVPASTSFGFGQDVHSIHDNRKFEDVSYRHDEHVMVSPPAPAPASSTDSSASRSSTSSTSATASSTAAAATEPVERNSSTATTTTATSSATTSATEKMVAAFLSDPSDTTRLTTEEVVLGWGSWANFMLSYGLEPSSATDRARALEISKARTGRTAVKSGGVRP